MHAVDEFVKREVNIKLMKIVIDMNARSTIVCLHREKRLTIPTFVQIGFYLRLPEIVVIRCEDIVVL